MFSGIIETTGKVISMTDSGTGLKFSISVNNINFFKNLPVGASISVNGACMTIESKKNKSFNFTTVKESLSKTNLGKLKINDYVNLEKPISLNTLLHGHIVSGHIDTTGVITKILNKNKSWEYFIKFNKKYVKNIIEMGSIAVNGVSLTIADIIRPKGNSAEIKVAIIPHTYKETIFQYSIVGDAVNLEFDVIGKYILNK
ncbi:MAG TPA: riboflavin synthase [Ignavibacteria bacterium]|nr:riboflavin synthase [Ignavibacteria bacterium]